MIEIFNHGSLYVDRGYIAISKASLLWNILRTVKETCLLEQGATTFQAIIMCATWLMKLELYIVWCDRSKRGCKGSNGPDLNYTEKKKKCWGLFFIIQWWCWWRNWDRSHDDSRVDVGACRQKVRMRWSHGRKWRTTTTTKCHHHRSKAENRLKSQRLKKSFTHKNPYDLLCVSMLIVIVPWLWLCSMH